MIDKGYVEITRNEKKNDYFLFCKICATLLLGERVFLSGTDVLAICTVWAVLWCYLKKNTQYIFIADVTLFLLVIIVQR